MRTRLLSLLILSISIFPGCEKRDFAEIFKKSAFVMGTIVNVTVVDSDEKTASLKIEKAINEIRRIEKMMGRSHPESDILKINNSAGKGPALVSSETLHVIKGALPLSSLTKGKFDITIGPLTNLWDFEKKAKQEFVPSMEETGLAKSLIGLDGLEINEEKGTVFLKKKGAALDLGGIAKGYAVDKAINLLQMAGVKGGIVDAGGDLRLFGLKPDGGLWKTGIRDPRNPNGIFAILEITDKAVISSGDYERYFIKDAKRYHHILDPETGYPAGKCRSVTIVTSSASYADAIGTGLFVLGPEKGIEVINREKGLEGVIVAEDGEILVSDGLKGKLEIRTPGP